ncbi:MAG: nucleotidyltransferase domain-containing protein [Ignavibacteriaceae bacterium]|jgi:predicted nucleotidyltransferase|nr:nucleotidyltransferase domain-containing protein [Ignavibacteriaceae bacterium]
MLPNLIKNKISKNKNIAFAILFGSHATGKVRFGSDLDLAIYFKAEPELLEIGDLVNQLQEITEDKIDLVKLNGLYSSRPGLAYNIIKDGIVIYSEDSLLLAEYKRKVFLEYLNFKPIADMFHNRYLQRLTAHKSGRSSLC